MFIVDFHDCISPKHVFRVAIIYVIFNKVCHRFRITKLNYNFESVLTTFEATVIFEAARAVAKNLLEPKTKPL